MRKLLREFSFFVGLFLVIFMIGIMSWQLATAAPNGATVTSGTPERDPENDAAGTANAQAGNVTGLTLFGQSVTQAWQGFFGNVSGAITLADANGNDFYNWSLAEPSGEVFASTNSSLTWTTIQCLNFTANGSEDGNLDSETAGGTSLSGINVSDLEAQYGIAAGDADGVNETFGFTITHDAFTVGSLSFTAGECLATAAFDSTGQSTDNNFEEALLYEPSTSSVVFAAILEQGALNGFDDDDHDFEMLVLEDGHSGDTTHTVYNFWVELE